MSNDKNIDNLEIGNPAVIAALLAGDFENALVAATPSGIVQQEKTGQAWFVESSTLPINADCEGYLSKLGFIYHNMVDKLFVKVTMPDGWRIEAHPTHDRWSYLFDPKGGKRAGIFYKAAFYDRRASIQLTQRYLPEFCPGTPQNRNEVDSETEYWCVIDNATGEQVWSSQACHESDNAAYEANEDAAYTWLDTSFPRWRDATAYWD